MLLRELKEPDSKSSGSPEVFRVSSLIQYRNTRSQKQGQHKPKETLPTFKRGKNAHTRYIVISESTTFLSDYRVLQNFGVEH